jgi:hypothetical protein
MADDYGREHCINLARFASPFPVHPQNPPTNSSLMRLTSKQCDQIMILATQREKIAFPLLATSGCSIDKERLIATPF